MKRQIGTILGVAILAGTLLNGCRTAPVTHNPVVVSPTGEIYVPERPPSPPNEAPGAPPSVNEVWVPGYWTYHDSQWAWMPGHWTVPPLTSRTWVEGHWDHTLRGWFWTPGHWE